jgi:hypothetical protein
MIFHMDTDRAYRIYLGWYQQATRIKLRQRWTNDDYVDGGSSDDEDTMYDTRTREGSHVEQGPILDRVVCCLSTFSAFVMMFHSIEILMDAGCSMPTIYERDRGHAGCVG